jgi:uncharacterized RDD family membrane protein YckC
MSGGWYPDEADFVEGVLLRRCIAWVVDLVLIGLLVFLLWLAMTAIGVLTLGLGFGLMALLPIVPFLYHFLSLLSVRSATPGQRLLGLTVRRDADLGPPTALQAIISVVLYYVTLATSGLLLLVALFTIRKRTLHDIVSGLVVVRVRAMEALTAPPAYGNIPSGRGAT